MNKNRIVRIKYASSKSGDPWKEGAKNLVGKTLVSNLAGDDLIIPDDVELVLSTNDYSISVNTTTSEPLSEIAETASNLFGYTASKSISKVAAVANTVGFLGSAGTSAIGGGNWRFSPWYRNIKAWKDSQVTLSPLQFEFSLGQFGLWNAKQEVFAPVLSLLALALPTEQQVFVSKGSFLTAAALIGKYVENTASAAFTFLEEDITGEEAGFLEKVSGLMQNILKDGNSRYYHIAIGDDFVLQYCAITAANVTLSTEVDQYGYPISATVNLTVEGTVPAAIQSEGVLAGMRFGRPGAADQKIPQVANENSSGKPPRGITRSFMGGAW